MRQVLLLVAALAVALGCADPERPGLREENVQGEDVLKRRFADGALSRAERTDAGRALLGRDGGAVYIASHFGGKDRDLVRGLLDSVATGNPIQAARLTAQLMAVAKGEEKLDFETALLEQGDNAVAPLIELLGESPDWQTAVQTLDALGKLRARESVDAISACLRDQNTWVRMAAAHALGNVAGPKVAGLLAAALEDTADVVVAAALVGLGKTGDPKAMDLCAGQLGHPNPRVRGAAVSAVGRLGGTEAPRLIRTALSDPDPGVQHKARRALERLGEGDHPKIRQSLTTENTEFTEEE